MAQGREERVVVVTGASSGIGRATARLLAERGAAVVLAARNEAALEEVAEVVRQAGGRALVVPTDVTDSEAVARLAFETLQHFGRIDAWVNNAGVYLMGRFDETPVAVHERVIDVNLLGTLYGSREAVRQFRRQGWGTLVNVSSLAGRAPYAFGATYCASKHAVRGITEAIRQENIGTGISVSTVYPPTIDTPLFEHAANYTGRRMRAMPPVYSVERAARAIVSAIDAPREVVIGAIPRAFTLFKMLARPLYDRLQPKMIQSSHFTDESAAESAGNLFMPQGRNSEAGGWLEGRRKLGVAAAIALPLLGAAALFFGRTRRGRLLAGRAADAARGLAKPVREALGRGFPALAG